MNSSYIQTVLDETIKTVSVSFNVGMNHKGRVYTYKTRLDLEEGDVCPVPTTDGIALAEVTRVHDEPEIGPHDSFNYKWITQKIDVEAIQRSVKEDQVFYRKFRDQQRKKDREKAREMLKEELGDDLLLTMKNVEDSFDVED